MVMMLAFVMMVAMLMVMMLMFMMMVAMLMVMMLTFMMMVAMLMVMMLAFVMMVAMLMVMMLTFMMMVPMLMVMMPATMMMVVTIIPIPDFSTSANKSFPTSSVSVSFIAAKVIFFIFKIHIHLSYKFIEVGRPVIKILEIVEMDWTNE
ncbi:hypothetical protein J1TS3_09500 [Siminovitchia fordii]|uniref:NADH dehydrogenase subunit 6 n=1 Tax=Siminovitchia fordii TaxID=254759 RepID=A0ABQ4K230_9BACI|nr:hypothetical protein J1TS3_09500 [Siminovitchia fordii]